MVGPRARAFHTYIQFENFVYELFESIVGGQFQIQREHILRFAGGTFQADIFFETDTEAFIVEVKSSSSSHNVSGLVRRATSQLYEVLNVREAYTGILVVNAVVSDELIKSVENEGIFVLDYRALYVLAIQTGKLEEFRQITAELTPIGSLEGFTGFDFPEKLLALGLNGDLKFEDDTHLKCDTLLSELKSVDGGKDAAKKFEKVVTETLKFLFEEHLSLWAEQHRSDSSMSINDLVVKVQSEHDFWKTIRESFNSLFVIFEFKNYSEKVGQDQVFSTERYLYRTALRSVAVMISQHGLNANAEKAAKGALRENGKLILSITKEDLISMLEARRDGDDPHFRLVEALDQMLTKIER